MYDGIMYLVLRMPPFSRVVENEERDPRRDEGAPGRSG